MIGPPQNPIRGVFQPGMKRPYPPPIDNPNSVSLQAKSCGPLVREDGHNESTVPNKDSFVVITQGTSDNMSDLFPQKSVSKSVQE